MYGSAAGKTAVGTPEGISRAESPTRYRSFYVSTAPSRYPLHISETYSTLNRRFIFVYSVVVGFFLFLEFNSLFFFFYYVILNKSHTLTTVFQSVCVCVFFSVLRRVL